MQRLKNMLQWLKFRYGLRWGKYTLHKIVSSVVLAILAVAALTYTVIKECQAEKARHAYYQTMEQRYIEAHIQIDKYERVIIGCLADVGVVVDNINRPCKIGEYKRWDL
jgi:hypothetical protein